MPKESLGRIPTLDGLRAISIGLVLCAHIPGTGLIPVIPQLMWLGEAGVRTFFVISGFLITTLLLRERDKTGRVSLKDFYIRRVFRIFPAFYTYIGVFAVLAAIGVVAIPRLDFVFAATYTMNFHEHRAWYLGHMWSLAVEEQFYIVWPLAFVVLGSRRALWFAIGAVIAAPILRVATLRLWPEWAGLLDQAFPFVFDSIALGCALALLRPRLEAWPRYRALIDAPWFWIVPIGLILTLMITKPVVEMGVTTTLGNLGIALAIHRCVLAPEGALGRILERPGFIWVGTLSYSLYLWQQPFLDRHDHRWWTTLPVNVALAIAVAVVSYYGIEKPWLRIGRRFRNA